MSRTRLARRLVVLGWYGRGDRLVEVCDTSPAAIDVVAVSGEHAGPEHGLGAPGQLRLVRPDGHIGLVAPVGAVDVLRSYLDTYVHPEARSRTREPAVPPTGSTAPTGSTGPTGPTGSTSPSGSSAPTGEGGEGQT